MEKPKQKQKAHIRDPLFIDRCATLFKDGKKPAEIAKDLGVCTRTVYRALTLRGFKKYTQRKF